MDTNSNDISQDIKERMEQLPPAVRDAIATADIEKRLRTLADTNKLHLDQWDKLENEVMLTVLGFLPASELPQNIQNEVGVSQEVSTQLAVSINQVIFEPIRQELERSLESPAAQEKVLTPEEAARQQILAQNAAPSSPPPSLSRGVLDKPTAAIVGTPPTPPPTEKAIRSPLSSAYTSGQPSTLRKTVDDPYREPPK